jgi:queuosine precursor transporter
MQKLDLLISLYIGFLAIAELMGAKTFPLFKIGNYELATTTAIFVMPFIFTVNDVITEVYGPEKTRSIIRSGLIVVALFSLAAIFFTSLPPSKRFLVTEPAYDKIFLQSARISIASLIAFAVSEFTDVFIFVKIRKALGHKALWFRNNISNFVSQFCDTAIFMTLAFYATNKPLNDNFLFLSGIILPYWLVKCSMSIIETPLVYIGVKWLKREAK